MRQMLIAIATAGLLASGAAAAGTTVQVKDDFATGFVPVQYDRPQYDRQWQDRSDDRLGNINEREARIRDRIQRGMNDGRITDFEARRLWRELGSIEAKERAFRADGRINGREFDELNRDLDRLAEDVRSQLRDEQRRH